MISANTNKRGVLLAIDRWTAIGGGIGANLTADDLARAACLSALIGAGLHVEAEELARGRGPITQQDAMAALGLLLVRNLSKIGRNVSKEIERLASK